MSVLDWTHAVTDVPRTRRAFERVATLEERAAVAAALGVPEVGQLTATYGLAAPGPSRYRMDGTLHARLLQTCVVTLEPIPLTLELPLEAEFRADPDSVRPSGSNEEEVEILSLPDFEPIEEGQLGVGRVVFETLGAGLDPYPKKDGATFTWTDEEGARAISPFAALAKLKRETP